MKDKPSLEARILYSLPPEPRKRINRLLLLSFLGSIIFFVVLGGSLSLMGGKGLMQWKTGLIILSISIINILTAPLWQSRIQTPLIFYLASGFIRIPLFLMMLAFGTSGLELLLPNRSSLWIKLGLLLGTISIPFLIRRKLDWISASLENGHLRYCLDRTDWTWDTRHDADHIREDPKKMRPGFFWRFVTWIGPVIGMSLAGIIGRLNTYVIMALVGTLVGYLTLISLLTDTISLSVELSRLEKDHGKPILLKMPQDGQQL